MIESRIDTPARQQLVAWMAVEPRIRTRGFIARSVGVSQPAVTGWLTGATRPVPELRSAIHVLTGINPDAWKRQDERDREAKSLRLAAVAAAGMTETSDEDPVLAKAG